MDEARRRARRVVFAVLLLAVCTPLVMCGWCAATVAPEPRPDDAALRRAFASHRTAFERLRAMITADPGLNEVRVDSYSWTDPCSVGPCEGAVAPVGGRPPGVLPRPCDWPGGCTRWVDEPPDEAVLAGIGGISPGRARRYLDDLDETGAVAVVEEPGAVSFWMHLAGIIPSGSTKAIEWRASPPPAVVPDTEAAVTTAHGAVRSPITGGWYISLSWN